MRMWKRKKADTHTHTRSNQFIEDAIKIVEMSNVCVIKERVQMWKVSIQSSFRFSGGGSGGGADIKYYLNRIPYYYINGSPPPPPPLPPLFLWKLLFSPFTGQKWGRDVRNRERGFHRQCCVVGRRVVVVVGGECQKKIHAWWRNLVTRKSRKKFITV